MVQIERTREKRGMERIERMEGVKKKKWKGDEGEDNAQMRIERAAQSASKSNDKASKMPPGGRKKGNEAVWAEGT